MNLHRFAGAGIVCLLTAGGAAPLHATSQGQPSQHADAGESVTLYRVFLKDGTTLVSYGEMARLDDRVVFSMPTSASTAAPQLQLITIPSDRVDWERTLNYAESVRAKRYL